MRKISLKISLSIILFSSLFLLGMSDVEISDVEIAIVQHDFKRAYDLAKQVPNESLTDFERNKLKYYLGVCSLRLDLYDEAKDYFNKLIKSKHDKLLRDKAYLGLFDSSYLKGDYKAANKIIKKLLKLSPNSDLLSLIYLKAARSNLKLANWQEAKLYLNKITNNFPKSVEYYTAKQLLEEEQYFAVQVGAFMDERRAKQLAYELKQKKEYAYIIETVDQQSRKFYRVRVGKLALLEEAEELKDKLSGQGYPATIFP